MANVELGSRPGGTGGVTVRQTTVLHNSIAQCITEQRPQQWPVVWHHCFRATIAAPRSYTSDSRVAH